MYLSATAGQLYNKSDFANWGEVGHNVPRTSMNTTVLTTKGCSGEGIKANVLG